MNRARLAYSLIRVLVLSLVVMSCITAVNAQDIQYTKDSVDKNKRSSLTVDPSSLGLNLSIPFASYSGRAGINLPIALQYSSKVWRMEYGGNTGLNPHVAGWVYPVFDERGGWTSTLGIPVLRNASTERPFTGAGTPAIDGQYVVYGMAVQMPDGSTHQLRKNDYVAQVDINHPYNADGTYYAIDGSHLKLEFHTGTNAPPNILYLADGSRYTFAHDANGYDLVTLTDRNGNTLTYGRNQNGAYQWTDTLGRAFGLLLPSNPAVGYQTYTMPGMGTSNVTYQLRWRNLADVRTDANQPLRYVAPYNSCDMQTATTHSPSLFGNGTTCDGDEFYNQLFNPVLLAEIILPNGQSYKFTYNVFGELDKIVYPTGGYERFQHDTIPSISYVRNLYAQGNRGVTDRWVSVDGGGADENEHHWHYQVSDPNNTPPYKVTITAPDGSYTDRYLYSAQEIGPFKLEDVKLGRAYDERMYSATGQMLRRVLTDWITSGPMSGGQTSATRNPRINKQVEILLDTGGDALVKTTTYGYDASFEFTTGIEQTSVTQYDYAYTDQSTAQTVTIESMPVNTSWLRKTETDYLDGDAAYRNLNLIGLVSATRVKDANGNIVAQTTMTYDQSALLTYSSVQSWNDPNTIYRANVTTVSRWLNTTSSWLQTHTQYDQFGNIRKVWDAKDTLLINPAEIQYSATFKYAFPTLTISSDPDLTDTSNGPLVPLITSTDYDLPTALTIQATDANGVFSTPEYNDSLLRPTKTVSASGNVAQTQGGVEYLDGEHAIVAKSDLSSFNDNTLKARTLYDGLARTSEARTYEDATNYIAVRTEYDAMGRAYKVSNPFRPLQNETPVWTTSEFDALGRVKKVTSPDGAVVTISYSGNTVTVTDQAGKKRRSVTDALGRVARVDEPDANGNLDVNGQPAQSTYYSYDALDNLIQVTQGSQTRTFIYDSLKRLLSASNPEGGRVVYQYDANGNLTKKSDARLLADNVTHVSVTLEYDALNRVTSRSYNDGTPAVTYVYDNPANGANGLGRLWKTETAGVSRTAINNYDALGRPTSVSQQFYVNGTWGELFTTKADYDKAGHIKHEEYPSHRSITNTFDSVGRLLTFTGDLGDGVQRTYASGSSYSSFGGLQQEQFGTDNAPLFHKLHYNVRGQLYDVRLSTLSLAQNEFDWNRGRLNFYYGGAPWGQSSATNNGNVTMQQHWVPLNEELTSYSYTQDSYSYDSLNRLTSVTELHGSPSGQSGTDYVQAFTYDRFGNRTINTAETSGAVNNLQTWIDSANNRLYAPSDQNVTDPEQRLIRYDAAGNQKADYYSAGWNGIRTYDAENRMKSATDTANHVSTYVYDGDGRRIKRIVNGAETWQVYGLGGELIAEYAANSAPENPQKEYGYRNGELLITADVATVGENDRASVDFSAVQGQTNWYYQDSNGAGMSYVSSGNWWQGAETYNLLWSGGGHPGNNSDAVRQWRAPQAGTIHVTGSASDANNACGDGVIVSILKGAQVLWQQTINNGNISGFSYDLTTTVTAGQQINFVINKRTDNLCDSTNFDPTVSFAPTYQASADFSATQGQTNWYYLDSTGAPMSYISANNWWKGAETYNLVWNSGGHPGENADAIRQWRAATAGTIHITGNASDAHAACGDGVVVSIKKGGALLWQKTIDNGDYVGFSFDLTTSVVAGDEINFIINKRGDYYCDSTAFDPTIVYTSGAAQLHWLVTDQLGTPRMIVDQTGSLARVTRHDYLPFGEELGANVGGRTTAQGYSASDGVRQHFTDKERDNETGLDYFLARYYSSTQGRFTSVDPILASARKTNPQSWNRYVYVLNNPLRLVDPDGLEGQESLADMARRMREARNNELLTTDTTAEGEIAYHPLTPEMADWKSKANADAGPLSGPLLHNANQARQDALAMVAPPPAGQVNPCRTVLQQYSADPTADLLATVTTGGVAQMDSGGNVGPGPQNVLNGNTTTDTAEDNGTRIAIPKFLEKHSDVVAVNAGDRTYLAAGRFNGEDRLARAQTMIHERVFHVGANLRDDHFAPPGSANPRSAGSNRINEIIRANCNRLPRN